MGKDLFAQKWPVITSHDVAIGKMFPEEEKC